MNHYSLWAIIKLQFGAAHHSDMAHFLATILVNAPPLWFVCA